MNSLEQLSGLVYGDAMGDRESELAGLPTLDCAQERYPAAGAPLWSDGKRMTVDDGEAHTLIIAGSGAGKTVSLVLPMLRCCVKAGENLLVTDTKSGELYRSAVPYLEQQGYRTWVVDLRHPDQGDRYDPLLLPLELLHHTDGGMQSQGHELLWDLADTVTIQEANSVDPFWDCTARDAFLASAYLLSELAPKQAWTLSALHALYREGVAPVTPGKAMNTFRAIERFHLLPEASPVWAPLYSRLNAEDSPKTAASIDTVFLTKLNQLVSTPVQAHLFSTSDMDFWTLDRPRTALFLLLPDETSSQVGIASLLTKQVYRQLCLLADLRHAGRLPCRWNFLLEEFGNLDLRQDAARVFSAGRSRNIRVTAVVQDLSQLTARYGAEEAAGIRFNCDNWVYLHSRDLATLRELSELCGTRTFAGAGRSEPVASVSALQRIPMGQALVFHGRGRPFLTDLSPIWAYPETAPVCAAPPSHSHPPCPAADFSLRQWVRKGILAAD